MADSKKASDFDATASVVIPTFKRQALAMQAAITLRRLVPKAQIIIVEQEARSMPALETLRENEIQYISLKIANTSEAKNRGVKKSTGDIVFFFDDDVELTPHTIQAHLNAYQDLHVVATSGRVINDNESVPNNTDVITGTSNFFATDFKKRFWSTRKQYVDFPYGCNMSFRRDVLEKTGGFDTTFPKIFEEIDLGKRVQKYGKIVFVPEALVFHHKAQSGGTREAHKKKASMLYRYYGRYIAKHVPFPLSLFTLLKRTVTVLNEASFALYDLYDGYADYFVHTFPPEKNTS